MTVALPPTAHPLAVTEVLADGRRVVGGEWVLPLDVRDGCWCGDTLYDMCAHQRVAAALGRARGVAPMPAIPARAVLSIRLGSDIASHPGIQQKQWLRLLHHAPAEAWRVAGYRLAREDAAVLEVLRAARDLRVVAQLLMHLPLGRWGEIREDVYQLCGPGEAAMRLRGWAERRLQRSALTLRDARLQGDALRPFLKDAGVNQGRRATPGVPPVPGRIALPLRRATR